MARTQVRQVDILSLALVCLRCSWEEAVHPPPATIRARGAAAGLSPVLLPKFDAPTVHIVATHSTECQLRGMQVHGAVRLRKIYVRCYMFRAHTFSWSCF